MESGKWKVGKNNGKWKVDSGKWEVKNNGDNFFSTTKSTKKNRLQAEFSVPLCLRENKTIQPRD